MFSTRKAVALCVLAFLSHRNEQPQTPTPSPRATKQSLNKEHSDASHGNNSYEMTVGVK